MNDRWANLSVQTSRTQPGIKLETMVFSIYVTRWTFPAQKSERWIKPGSKFLLIWSQRFLQRGFWVFWSFHEIHEVHFLHASESGSERCRNKRLNLQNADRRKSRGPYRSPPHVGKISFGYGDTFPSNILHADPFYYLMNQKMFSRRRRAIFLRFRSETLRRSVWFMIPSSPE